MRTQWWLDNTTAVQPKFTRQVFKRWKQLLYSGMISFDVRIQYLRDIIWLLVIEAFAVCLTKPTLKWVTGKIVYYHQVSLDLSWGWSVLFWINKVFKLWALVFCFPVFIFSFCSYSTANVTRSQVGATCERGMNKENDARKSGVKNAKFSDTCSWERKFKAVYHLHGETGWFTIWANDKQKHWIEIPNEIWRVPFTRIYLEQLELNWVTTYMGGKWRKANGIMEFSIRIFRLLISDYLLSRSAYFGNFPPGLSIIVLPFTT